MKNMNNHFGQSRIFCKTPMNLQIFGNDAGDNADGGGTGDSSTGDDGEEELTREQLIEALAKERADKERFKNSIDDLTKKNKNLSQAVKDRMTAEEQAEAARTEAEQAKDKKIAELESKFLMLDYSKRLMGIGMDETAATELAGLTGELADADKFFSALDKFVKAATKKAGEDAVQALVKSNPSINAGNGTGGADDLATQKAKELKKSQRAVNSDVLKNFM